MNKYLLLFILATLSLTVNAQNFTVTPNPAYGEEDTDSGTNPDDVVAHANITNNTSDTLFLRWERIVNDKPECWQTAVCDVNLCYFPTVSSMEFVLLPNMSGGEMLVHAYTGGEPGENPTIGEAEVVIKISNLNDPADTLLVEYYFTVTGSISCVTNISEPEKEALNVFPNPASDYFRLTETQEIQHIVIYNILGNQVKVFDINSNQNYNISDLPSGVYLVGMIDRDQEIVKTVKLQKR